MNENELRTFLMKHKIQPQQLAELIGLTPMAVNHWLSGRRAIAKPYGRLLRLFDRHPELMTDFK